MNGRVDRKTAVVAWVQASPADTRTYNGTLPTLCELSEQRLGVVDCWVQGWRGIQPVCVKRSRDQTHAQQSYAPLSVEIVARQRAAQVPVDDAVRVEHRHDFEDHIPSQVLCLGVR